MQEQPARGRRVSRRCYKVCTRPGSGTLRGGPCAPVVSQAFISWLHRAGKRKGGGPIKLCLSTPLELVQRPGCAFLTSQGVPEVFCDCGQGRNDPQNCCPVIEKSLPPIFDLRGLKLWAFVLPCRWAKIGVILAPVALMDRNKQSEYRDDPFGQSRVTKY